MLKYELLHDKLLHEGVVEEHAFFEPSLLGKQLLAGVHHKTYWQRLLNQKLTRKEIRRIGFPLSSALIERELRIAHGTVLAAKIALKQGVGFNISGGTHHAGSDWGEGFCLLNDQAIAARYLLNHHPVEQVLVIDLDVHQGNGTAEIFEDEDHVFTFSMHGEKNFPFRKERSDLDVGLDDDTSGADYLAVLDQKVNQLFKSVQPDFVFYQTGADVLETDKMGRLKLTAEDCRQRDKLVFDLCKKHQKPVQVSMGGGYSTQIKDIVKVHCQTFKEGIAAIQY